MAALASANIIANEDGDNVAADECKLAPERRLLGQTWPGRLRLFVGRPAAAGRRESERAREWRRKFTIC